VGRTPSSNRKRSGGAAYSGWDGSGFDGVEGCDEDAGCWAGEELEEGGEGSVLQRGGGGFMAMRGMGRDDSADDDDDSQQQQLEPMDEFSGGRYDQPVNQLAKIATIIQQVSALTLTTLCCSHTVHVVGLRSQHDIRTYEGNP
jgi:hypothetical protein